VSPSLSYPRAHCNNTRQFTAAVAAMLSVDQLLLLGEGIIGKFKKETAPTHTDRQTDSCCWRPPIRLHVPMRLICFCDGTKSEMIVINCLPYRLKWRLSTQHMSR